MGNKILVALTTKIAYNEKAIVDADNNEAIAESLKKIVRDIEKIYATLANAINKNAA